MRIIARMFEQNGTLFIGAGIAVLVLILLVIVSRRMRRANATENGEAAMSSAPQFGGDIELEMADDENAEAEAIMFEADGSSDRMVDDAAHQFDMDDDALDDIDDLTIPKVGEAPPPPQVKIFQRLMAAPRQG